MNSEKMKELRGQIDALDDQIIELLLKRIDLSSSIIRSKDPGPVVDLGREQAICQRYLGRLESVTTAEKVKNVVKAILAVSKLYPED